MSADHQGPSDADLHARVREVVRALPFPTTDVMVSACAGTISLRGEAATREQVAAVIGAVSATADVLAVEDFLHLPGEVATNKAPSIRASQPRP